MTSVVMLGGPMTRDVKEIVVMVSAVILNVIILSDTMLNVIW